MPIDLRSVVPVVPMKLPDNTSHHNAAWLRTNVSFGAARPGPKP